MARADSDDLIRLPKEEIKLLKQVLKALTKPPVEDLFQALTMVEDVCERAEDDRLLDLLDLSADTRFYLAATRESLAAYMKIIRAEKVPKKTQPETVET